MNEGHRTSSIPRPRNATGGVATRTAKRSTVPARSERAPASKPGLLDDYTTPIAREDQIVRKGHGRLILGAVGALIALAIGAALFVLPIKSWMHQRNDLTVRTDELSTLNAANAQLQTEVDRLQTDEGIREAARTEIDYVPNGEKRITVLATPAASTALPAGWPYDMVSSIIALRQAEAVAATTPSTTSAVAATTAP